MNSSMSNFNSGINLNGNLNELSCFMDFDDKLQKHTFSDFLVAMTIVRTF